MDHMHHEQAAEHQHHAHDQTHGGGHEHGDHSGHDPGIFKRKLLLSIIFSIPVVFWAEMIQDWFGYSAPEFTGSQYIPLIFSTIVFFYGGIVFLRGAWGELKGRAPGMMTLISLAILVAYLYSVATEIGLSGEPLYWELATLVVIMLLGHWIEMRSVQRAGSALDELAKLLPDTAERIEEDQTVEVPLSDLQLGDLVLVRPGANIPIDGVIESGASNINESMMTGESRPVKRGPGDEVIGGTLNGEGSLRVRVNRTGENTTLSGIMKIVDEAQRSRSRVQALADRAAFWLTLIAITAGSVTFVVWLLVDDALADAISRTVTVLVITCPHALGLAIPLVIAISTSLSARNGLLVRNRIALEQARLVDTVIFDKTGTLTRGTLGVTDIATVDGLDKDEVLARAAAVESDSEHPIARAITEAAANTNGALPQVTGFEAIAGRGVQAQLDGSTVSVGGPRLLEQLNIEAPEQLSARAREWGEAGRSVVYLIEDEQPTAAFAVADVIRDESAEAVRLLHEAGVRVAIITGDSRDVAASVAAELGVDDFYAEVLPGDKAKQVEALQQQGQRVAMVGDGVNDAPALATADVGIAIGAGTDVAIESADIILVRDDPRAVAGTLRLSQATYSKMKQNLAWATGYNVVAIPLAAGVLAPWGIVLVPAIGALLMSASTVIVAINAQLLRRVRLA